MAQEASADIEGMAGGFEILPRLYSKATDEEDWETLLLVMRDAFRNDASVLFTEQAIVFRAAVDMVLPTDGNEFQRFGCRTWASPQLIKDTWACIRRVRNVAMTVFGVRIQAWFGDVGHLGFYGWNTVDRSVNAYGQPETAIAENTLPLSMPSWDEPAIIGIVPDKCMGVLAAVDLPRGTTILMERPMLVQRRLPDDQLGEEIVRKLRLGTADALRQFANMENSFPGIDVFAGIFRTNAMEHGQAGSDNHLYRVASNFNHSCWPNALHTWNPQKQVLQVTTMEPIRCGEEITICYGRGAVFREEQQYLRATYGFSCVCRRCQLPAAELAVTDRRRLLLGRLDDALCDPYGTEHTPAESLRVCRTLLREFAAEYGGYAAAHAMRLYYAGFQIVAAHGDLARGLVFLLRCRDAAVLCLGPHAHPTLHGMDHFLRHMEQYPHVRVFSSRWRRAVHRIPVHLGASAFETWLFRNLPALSDAELRASYPLGPNELAVVGRPPDVA